MSIKNLLCDDDEAVLAIVHVFQIKGFPVQICPSGSVKIFKEIGRVQGARPKSRWVEQETNDLRTIADRGRDLDTVTPINWCHHA